MSIPVALSAYNFSITLWRITKGGKAKNSSSPQYIEKAFTATQPGSGCQAQYLAHLLFSLLAKRSMSDLQLRALPSDSKRVTDMDHSVSSLNSLEPLWASTLSTPGMWTAESQTLRWRAHVQIFLATLLQEKEATDPCLFMPATVAVLSDLIRMCTSETVSQRLRSERTANSSRMLMWRSISSGDHRPPPVRPVRVSCQPQP